MKTEAASLKKLLPTTRAINMESEGSYIKNLQKYSKDFVNVHRQPFQQRLFVTEILKDKGNVLYKQREYESARIRYEQALSIITSIESQKDKEKSKEHLKLVMENGTNSKESKRLKVIRVILLMNLAACYNKVSDSTNMEKAANEALGLDPNNPKILLMAAKAVFLKENKGIPEVEEAMNKLLLAHEIAPEDSHINQELRSMTGEYLNILKKSSAASQSLVDPQSQLFSFLNKEPRLPEGKKGQKGEKPSSLFTSPDVSFIQDEEIIKRRANNEATSELAVVPADKNNALKKKKKKKKRMKSSETENGGADPKSGGSKTLSTNTGGKLARDKKNDEEDEEEWSSYEEEEEEEEEDSTDRRAGESKTVRYDWKTGREIAYEDEQEEEGEEYEDGDSVESTEETKNDGKMSNEIEELGRFLEKRGKEIFDLYERTGRKKEAEELRLKLRKALMAKQQLEKLAALDLNRPKEKLKEIADKYGINLLDPSIKDELYKIQAQNLKDLGLWIENFCKEEENADFRVNPKLSQLKVQSQSLEHKKADGLNKSQKKKLKRKNAKLKKAANAQAKVNGTIAEEILKALTLEETQEKGVGKGANEAASEAQIKQGKNTNTDSKPQKAPDQGAYLSKLESLPLKEEPKLSNPIKLEDFGEFTGEEQRKLGQVHMEIEQDKGKLNGIRSRGSPWPGPGKGKEQEEEQEEEPILDITDLVNFFFVFVSILLFFSTLFHHNVYGFSVYELNLNE